MHYINIHIYIYISMDNKEKEAMDFGKALGGGIRGRVPGRGLRGKREGENDIILFQIKMIPSLSSKHMTKLCFCGPPHSQTPGI